LNRLYSRRQQADKLQWGEQQFGAAVRARLGQTIAQPVRVGSGCYAMKKKRLITLGQIDGKPVLVQTIKDKKGKYGRYLGEIWLENPSGDLVNMNDRMVDEGFAVYKDY
jgi:hypothetical protein